jgi:hypothetical protein
VGHSYTYYSPYYSPYASKHFYFNLYYFNLYRSDSNQIPLKLSLKLTPRFTKLAALR